MDLKKQIAYLNGYRDAEREKERTKQEFLFWKGRIQEIAQATRNPQAARWEAYYCGMLLGRYRKCLQARLLVEKAILQAGPGASAPAAALYRRPLHGSLCGTAGGK